MNAEALLDRDLATLTDEEVGVLRAERADHLTALVDRVAARVSGPGRCFLRADVAYFVARLRSRPEDPVSAEALDLDLAVTFLLPRPLGYYRRVAGEARRSGQLLAVCVRR
jgi:hypothetical protein